MGESVIHLDPFERVVPDHAVRRRRSSCGCGSGHQFGSGRAPDQYFSPLAPGDELAVSIYHRQKPGGAAFGQHHGSGFPKVYRDTVGDHVATGRPRRHVNRGQQHPRQGPCGQVRY